MHISGTHMHIHTKYEVSILNPAARRAVHRCQCQTPPMLDDNYARRTNHDYIGSFGRIPNEPKTPEDCCVALYLYKVNINVRNSIHTISYPLMLHLYALQFKYAMVHKDLKFKVIIFIMLRENIYKNSA